MRASQECHKFCPVRSLGPGVLADTLLSKQRVLWAVGGKEAHLEWGDVGWIDLLINFQREGKAESVLEDTHTHTHTHSLQVTVGACLAQAESCNIPPEVEVKLGQ